MHLEKKHPHGEEVLAGLHQKPEYKWQVLVLRLYSPYDALMGEMRFTASRAGLVHSKTNGNNGASESLDSSISLIPRIAWHKFPSPEMALSFPKWQIQL